MALIYYTQDFRVYVTRRCQDLFPPHPFFEGKALGTRLHHHHHHHHQHHHNISMIIVIIIITIRPTVCSSSVFPSHRKNVLMADKLFLRWSRDC